MTDATRFAPPGFGDSRRGISLAQLQTAAVWLMLVTSFYVKVEPAICDGLFVIALVFSFISGLSISTAIVPLIACLFLYNMGAFLGSLQVDGDDKVPMYVITSSYMAVSAVFFAFYVGMDPLRRMAIIRTPTIIAGAIAAVLGLLGYFDVAGLGDAFAFKQRAVATFKDPNVFSTFLIFPLLLLLQGFLLGTQRHKIMSLASFLAILAALFLAFSRGAWISCVFAAFMLVGLTFILTPQAAMRSRIVILTILGTIGAAVLFSLLLSVPEVRDLFLDRFTLFKDYDAGETGRFGNQVNSIPLLLLRPLGFGPLQFHKFFGLDPHNTYINAFASYGWLGGISYFLLIISTLAIGFKTVLTRTPWQNYSIVVFCPLFTTIFQGVQIDTDHWRHFYWLLGMMWGLFAASIHYRPGKKQLQD